MWKLTAEGRWLLRQGATECGGRNQFSSVVGIGKNQVKPLLDDADHAINDKTVRLLCNYWGDEHFRVGDHYDAVEKENKNSILIRLARDRDPTKNLNSYDQKAIQRLYNALYQNPQFEQLRPSLDIPVEFAKFFRVWNGPREHMPSEQFFVYRMFRDKVIAFLFGERHVRTAKNPIEVFAIWYLAGVSNALYEGSPAGLDADDEKALPLGERETAVNLSIRLLEELRDQRTISYLIFEVTAEELHHPDSYGRLLFRIYSHAVEDIRRHFANDALLRDAQAYVLDFPFLVPRQAINSHDYYLREHRLICCPLQVSLRERFKQGAVPAATVQALLATVYEMFWDYYDVDSPQRSAIKAAAEEAQTRFINDWVKPDRVIPCFTLRDYINSGFGKGLFISLRR